MPKRKTITKKTRFEVFKRDKFTCQYCGQSAPDAILHLDHIKPVAEGGDEDILNLITACFDCNMGKGARMLNDESTVKKQKAQLDLLQERREQIEMMAEWREGLAQQDIRNFQIISRELGRFVNSECFIYIKEDLPMLQREAKKFGPSYIIEAIEYCAENHLLDQNGFITLETGHRFMIMLPKIADLIKRNLDPKWGTQSYHLKNLLKGNMRWATPTDLEEARTELYQLLSGGVDFTYLRSHIVNTHSWEDYAQTLNLFI